MKRATKNSDQSESAVTISAESDSADSTEDKKNKKGKWLRRFAMAFLIFCCFWLAADFGYSWYVNSSIKSWEKSVTRNEEGVRPGCAAYSSGPSNAKTALLFVHGINDSPHVYRKVAKYLSEKDVYCRCMRLTGFGESVDAYGKAKIDDWLKDVDKELESLKSKHDRVVLVAHSMGGAISIRYVSLNSGKADGLVLAAPAIEVSSQRSPVLPVRTWHSLLSSVLVFSKVTYSPYGADALDENERLNELRTPYAPISVINQVFELVDLNRDAPKKLKLPLLFVLAKEDRVIDNEAAKKFAENCASKEVKLKVLDRSAHMIPVDFQWKEFSDSVYDFANGLSGAKVQK